MSRRGRFDEERTRSRIRERGAILVEAAIIAPIAIALVFGAMELGYAYYGKLTVEHMSIAGARAGSGSANDYLSDYNTLQAVEDAKTSMGASSITKIVIYRATGPGDRVPTACKSGPVTNTSGTRGCNYYTGAQLQNLNSLDFSSSCTGNTGSAVDKNWCPTGRQNVQSLGADYLGVYVQANYVTATGLFKSPFYLASRAVMRLEPK
jgi:Flp pilus assembly protein TadG